MSPFIFGSQGWGQLQLCFLFRISATAHWTDAISLNTVLGVRIGATT